MTDALYLLASVGFFAVAWGYVRFCARVR